jgi:hypothetical protein
MMRQFKKKIFFRTNLLINLNAQFIATKVNNSSNNTKHFCFKNYTNNNKLNPMSFAVYNLDSEMHSLISHYLKFYVKMQLKSPILFDRFTQNHLMTAPHLGLIFPAITPKPEKECDEFGFFDLPPLENNTMINKGGTFFAFKNMQLSGEIGQGQGFGNCLQFGYGNWSALGSFDHFLYHTVMRCSTGNKVHLCSSPIYYSQATLQKAGTELNNYLNLGKISII